MNERHFSARALLGVLLSLVLVVGLSACGDDGDESTVAQTGDGETAACDDIETVGAFVRLPPAENTAVYLDLTNNGDTDTALVGASADFAETFELHEMVEGDDGVLVMGAIDGQRIELPAGETVTLEPGGLHVMALGVTTDLVEGDVVPVTLEFDGGCTITVDAEVRAVDMPMEDMEHGGDMGDDGDMEHEGDMEHDGDMGDDGMGGDMSEEMGG